MKSMIRDTAGVHAAGGAAGGALRARSTICAR
jgi:hypothetical protein